MKSWPWSRRVFDSRATGQPLPMRDILEGLTLLLVNLSQKPIFDRLPYAVHRFAIDRDAVISAFEDFVGEFLVVMNLG